MVWHVWGSGRPVVLLHGGSGSWTHWLRNVEALARAGWRVCVPDLPGFGDSLAPPEARDAADLVAPLAQGVREVAGEACPWVGFSFGGLTAVLTVAAHPQLATRLVLVGVPGLGLRNRRLALTPWLGLSDPEARRRAHRRNLQVLMLHDPASIDEDTLALHAANLVRDRMRQRKLALTDVVARTLPSLQLPVDAILGEQDALYAGQLEAVEALLRQAPSFGRMLRIPQAGHWVQYEAPERFDAALLGLLRD
ncbi:alpha/beta fold hydrolase [Ramlibacter rhizophilus]|uniref:Alpha/beta fold hydrolase n=2 Tax=Ramlibacter rhizophilus TaxID=1781167 RepID=A0A4Z0BHP4_9BURK|nr:alpha/beta fold hydrolase [Ramlibacter rhizophilus]